MADEVTIVETWLVGLLLADATIAGLVGTAVYESVAPQGAGQPYVLVVYQQGSDVNGMGERGVAQPLFQVKGVGKHESMAALRALSDRIDTLLQGTRIISEGFHIRVKRESGIRYPDFSTGIEYQHRGGMYRCRVG